MKEWVMGHKHYYDDDEECRDRFNDAVKSGGYPYINVDEDGNLLSDPYEDWKYETNRSSRGDYYHEDDDQKYDEGESDDDFKDRMSD